MENKTPQETLSDANNIWQKILSGIRKELSEQSFNTWIKPVACKSIGTEALVLSVPDQFYGEWLHEHYEDIMKSAAAEMIGARPEIHYVVVEQPQFETTVAPTPDRPSGTKKRPSDIDLNRKYTFDDFVIGPGNRFAHAAALAVAEDPAKQYNPLFIYGSVGLGKTHLLQSIAQTVMAKNPSSKVVYISSEQFTNQLISAIQTRTTAAFRERYRTADLLLIDDIHFIAGKESTQEEFFHTFNTLYDAHKQIVVTSDRPPKDIPGLEERLVSRFGWGLVADIQPPELETRVAILKKIVDRQKVSVSNEVLFFIADKIRSNIRELEGALVRVIAYASLTGIPVDIHSAQNVLKDSFREEESKITIEHIQRCVCDYFGIKVSDLRAKRRSKSVVFPRQVAMYLVRELTVKSLPEIGDFFGGRGHATVIHAINKIKNRVKHDFETKRAVDQLLAAIRK